MPEAPGISPLPSIPLRSFSWLGAAFAYVTVRALPNLTYPIGRDQATFCVIADGLLRGQQLYRDLWDNKPPGIFYLYTGIVKLFGSVMWSVGVVDILWLFAISYCIFRFAERHTGTPAAAIAVAINASWHCRAGYVNAAQPETFIILLVFVSYFVVASEGHWMLVRQVVGGLLFAAAFWIKYNAIAFLPFLLFVPYLDWHSWKVKPFRLPLLIPWDNWLRRMLAFVTAFLVASVAVLGWFWHVGAWNSLREVQFEVLPRYVATAFHLTPLYWDFAVVTIIVTLGFLTIPVTIAAIVVAWQKKQLPTLMPVFLGAVSGFTSSAMQLRFGPYSFETCYPMFAILGGYLAVEAYRGARAFASEFKSRNRSANELLGWALLAVCVCLLLVWEGLDITQHYNYLDDWRRNPNTFYASYPKLYYHESFYDQIAAAHYLKERASHSAAAYVWGPFPLIYHLSELHPPNRFVSNFPLMASWGPPEWKKELISSLRTSPPVFIVVARNDSLYGVTLTKLDSEKYLKVFPDLNNFLSESYQPVVNFANFEIYQRGGAPPGGSNRAPLPRRRPEQQLPKSD